MEKHCDFIDLNLGCPQQMAKRGRYGAFMMEGTVFLSLSLYLSLPPLCLPSTNLRALKTGRGSKA